MRNRGFPGGRDWFSSHAALKTSRYSWKPQTLSWRNWTRRTADLLRDYPALRYYPPSGDLYFDVMTRLGEAASFDTLSAQTKSVEGINVRAAIEPFG